MRLKHFRYTQYRSVRLWRGPPYHGGMPFGSALPDRSGRKVTLKRVQNKALVCLFPKRSFTIRIPIETQWCCISMSLASLVYCKDSYSKWAFEEQTYQCFVLHSFQRNFSPRPIWKGGSKWHAHAVILWRNVQKRGCFSIIVEVQLTSKRVSDMDFGFHSERFCDMLRWSWSYNLCVTVYAQC